MSSIRLLTENEIGRVKTKFQEEADMALAEAIRAHVSFSRIKIQANVLTFFTLSEKHWNVRSTNLALGGTRLVRIRQCLQLHYEPNHLLPIHTAHRHMRHPALARHLEAPDRPGPTKGQGKCECSARQMQRPLQTVSVIGGLLAI